MLNSSLFYVIELSTEVKHVPTNTLVMSAFSVCEFTCTIAFGTNHDILHDKLSLVVSTLALVPLSSTFVAHLLPTGVTL